jgi:hypothetical protein
MRTVHVLRSLVALVALATACARADTAAAAPDTDVHSTDKRTDKRPDKGTDSMHGFNKAQASFRSHAAQVLKQAPDHVVVSPIEEDPSVQLDQRVGAAWAFSAADKDHPERQARGWAVADGSVITPDDNLGLLLGEAGVWSDHPALDASALADRLAWAMGANHRVVGPRSLHVDPRGTGTLSFQVGYRPPGPGGAGGGRERISQCTVTLTADHHARLTITAAPTAPAAPTLE